MVRAPYGYLQLELMDSNPIGDVFCLTIAIFRTFHLSNFQKFRFQCWKQVTCGFHIRIGSVSTVYVLVFFFSLENTLQVALGKCLGTAGTLRLPLVMSYRCIAPGEKESVNFTLKYNPGKGPQGKLCVKDDWIVLVVNAFCVNSHLALSRVFFHTFPSFTLALMKQAQDKTLSF